MLGADDHQGQMGSPTLQTSCFLERGSGRYFAKTYWGALGAISVGRLGCDSLPPERVRGDPEPLGGPFDGSVPLSWLSRSMAKLRVHRSVFRHWTSHCGGFPCEVLLLTGSF